MPWITGSLILLMVASVSAQLPPDVANAICPPASVNPCAALGALPPVPTGAPTAPSADSLCPPLAINVCSLTGGALSCTPLPTNNCFDLPTLVRASPYAATQDISSSNVEANEKFPCAMWFGTSVADYVKNSVWYRFSPTVNGNAVIHAGTATPMGGTWAPTDPGITVYTGSSLDKPALKKISCNDKGGAWGLPKGDAKFKCVAGATYQIQVWGLDPAFFGGSGFGDISFSIKGCDGPATIDLNPIVHAWAPCPTVPGSPPGPCLDESLPALPAV